MQDTSSGRLVPIPTKFLEGIPRSEHLGEALRQLGPEPGLPPPADRGAVFHVGQTVAVFDEAAMDGARAGYVQVTAGRFVISKLEPGRMVLRGVPKS